MTQAQDAALAAAQAGDFSQYSPDDFYDAFGYLPSVSSAQGGNMQVDSQGRPYIAGVSQGPAYYAIDADTAAKAQGRGIPVSSVNGLSLVSSEAAGVRGGIGSSALLPDMPTNSYWQDVRLPLAVALTAGAAGVAGLGAAAAEGAGAGAAGASAAGSAAGGAGGLGALGSSPLAGVGAAAANAANAGLGLEGAGGLGALAGSTVPASSFANAFGPGQVIDAAGNIVNSSSALGALGGADTLANNVPASSFTNAFGPGQSIDAAGNIVGGSSIAGNIAGGASSLSPLARLLGLGQTGSDIASVLGPLAGAGLGYLGSQQQADAYQNVANQQAAIGAPYRNQLSASYQPGFDLTSQPGYGDAFNRIADISSRSYSSQMGNPADNPTAQAGILSDVWNQGYLPALTNYRGQLGQFGGLGLNTSGAASLAGASQAGSGLNAIGYGVGSVTQPQNNLQSLLSQLGGNQNFSLNVGGLKYGG